MGDGRNSLLLRCILYVFGVVILVVALVLLLPQALSLATAVYIAVSAIVLYLLVFTPLVFGDNVRELTGGRIVASGIFWLVTIIFAVLSIVGMFVALAIPQPPLALLVVLQLVGVFGVAVALLVSGGTEDHIASVGREEDALLSPIETMRATSQDVAMRARHLANDDPSNPARARLAQSTAAIAEELRYLTPVQRSDANSMENGITQHLSALDATLRQPELGQRELVEACNLANDTELLVARRRALRN